jgi:hypothetical protein
VSTTNPPTPPAATLIYKNRIQSIWNNAATFLREEPACHSLQNHHERLALHIHINYGICRLSQLILDSPFYRASILELDIASLKKEMSQRAAEAVESFFNMHRLSANVCRSWAFVHNAVSCAFALRHFGTTAGGGEHAGLVGRLIGVLERKERLSEWEDADRSFRSSNVCGGGVPLSAWDLYGLTPIKAAEVEGSGAGAKIEYL